MAELPTAPGAGDGDAPRPKRILPEDATDWVIDQQRALHDPGFTYPGHRSFFNGVNALSNEFIEGYLAKRAELATSRRERNLAAHRLGKLRAETDALGTDNATVQALLAELEADTVRLTEEVARHEATVTERRATIAAIREKLNSEVKGLSLPVALLFLVGALLFAAADYGIAHNVAYMVLDFSEGEAVIFAISIACMPLVLKPFVERFVEHPYHRGEQPRFTKGFYAVVGSLALVYLGLFGYVRYHEELLAQKLEVAEAQREAAETALVLSGGNVADAAPATLLPDGAYRHRLPFYTMSGALAALAGAICLAMAFGPLPLHWNRLRYWGQVVRKRAHRRDEKALDRSRAELYGKRRQLSSYRSRAALFERLREGEHALLAAQEREYAVAGELVTLYTRDEYYRGGAYELEAPLRASVNRLDATDQDDDVDTSRGDGTSRGSSASPRSARRGSTADPRDGFLFQQLRQHILRKATKPTTES